jgi:hypothetical protein
MWCWSVLMKSAILVHFVGAGIHWSPLEEVVKPTFSSPAFNHPLLNPFHHLHLTFDNSVFETPGEKPGGSRAARVVGAALDLLVSLRVSRKGRYGWLNAGDEKGLTTSSREVSSTGAGNWQSLFFYVHFCE